MIFLDTGFLYALFRNSESYHDDAINIYRHYEKSNSIKVINSVVLTEILNRSKKLNLLTTQLFDVLNEKTHIVFLSEEDLKRALLLSKDYGYAINFSDYTIIKTMQDLDITRIISFDSDFDKIKGIERIH